MTPSNLMEYQASGSGSAPRSKRPRINFSHVHQEFDQIEILNARKNKNATPQAALDLQPRPGSSGSTSSSSLDDSLTGAAVAKKRKGKDDDWSKEKQEKSNKILALWIGGSTLPVSAVQDPNMLRYVKSLNPDATVPDRRQLTAGIATLGDKNILLIREALSTARRVNITTDIWSSKLSADSYIGVTAHFINNQERRRQWLKISKWFLRGRSTRFVIYVCLRLFQIQ